MLPGTLTFHHTPSSYEDALKYCTGNGAQLVKVQNEGEWMEVKARHLDCAHAFGEHHFMLHCDIAQV